MLLDSPMTKVQIKAPFRADHVGSFLRPERLKEAHYGKITASELRSIKDEEIVSLMEKPKEIGLQAVTDEEF